MDVQHRVRPGTASTVRRRVATCPERPPSTGLALVRIEVVKADSQSRTLTRNWVPLGARQRTPARGVGGGPGMDHARPGKAGRGHGPSPARRMDVRGGNGGSGSVRWDRLARLGVQAASAGVTVMVQPGLSFCSCRIR
jgi:hypothetical protein